MTAPHSIPVLPAGCNVTTPHSIPAGCNVTAPHSIPVLPAGCNVTTPHSIPAGCNVTAPHSIPTEHNVIANSSLHNIHVVRLKNDQTMQEEIRVEAN